MCERLWEPDAHVVVFHAGNSLGDSVLVTEARNYFHRLHLAARGNLAHWWDGSAKGSLS